MYGRIYLITDASNGKRYVGQTTLSIGHRWRQHLRGPTSPLLQHALRAHGVAAFRIEEIAVAGSREELDRLEREHIRDLGTLVPAGYNLHAGGDSREWHAVSRAKLAANKRRFWSEGQNRHRMLGAMFDPVTMARRSEGLRRSWDAGRREQHRAALATLHTEEFRRAIGVRSSAAWQKPDSRARLIEAIRQRTRAPEARAKMSAFRKQEWERPEYRQKHAAAMRPARASPEYRARMSAALKAKCADPEFIKRRAEAIRLGKLRAKQKKTS